LELAAAQSLQGPAPQSRTFPTQYIRRTQGHAFASRFSRDWSLLEEEKERLRGYPGYQQEGAGRDSEHQERAEMVIVRLPAQGRLSSTPTGYTILEPMVNRPPRAEIVGGLPGIGAMLRWAARID
jgi:hypothetical protein